MHSRLTRRQLITTAGAGAAGLVVARLLTGHDDIGQRSSPGHGQGASASGPGRARPAPATEAARFKSSEQQHFHSRPGLRPQKITVDVPGSPPQPGLPRSNDVILLSPYSGPPEWGPMIIDGAGELVWFHPVTGPSNIKTANLRVQSYRGRPVLTWWRGKEASLGYGLGHYLLYDESYRQVAVVRAANGLLGDHHEFKVSPQGTALFTIFREVRRDLRPVGGPADGLILESVLQEIDIASGKLLMQWNSLDHLSIEESYRSYYGPVWDYCHCNSIEVDHDNNLLVSARHMCALYKIERHTGKIMWRLGGKNSDFTLGKGLEFAWQHDFGRVGHNRRYTLFNNASNGVTEIAGHSSGLLFEIDERRRHARLIQEFVHDPRLLATSMGSVQVQPNGDVFVGWGSEPYFTQYTAGGDVVFDAHLPPDGDSYRAYRARWVGRPRPAPTLVANRSAQGATLYASWNGATEVRSWRAYAGSGGESLHAVGTVPRSGFETGIAVGGAYRRFAVEALGHDGKVLGRSPAVKLGS